MVLLQMLSPLMERNGTFAVLNQDNMYKNGTSADALSNDGKK